jgi:hypothetical protein
MNWQAIHGFFRADDAQIYAEWARACPPDGTIVELGTLYGRSAACLMTELDRAGKSRVNVVCVDAFPGASLPIAAGNLHCYRGRIRLVQDDVVEYARRWRDASIWSVYYDADHSEEATQTAIKAWLPKIEYNGRIGGHDYCATFPGVPAAVMQTFGRRPDAVYGCSWDVVCTVSKNKQDSIA